MREIGRNRSSSGLDLATMLKPLGVVNGKVVHFQGHFDHSDTSAMTIERISRKAI